MANNNSVSANEIVLPVLIISIVLAVSLGFQTVQVMRDRDALHTFISQQDKPLEDARKLQAQLTALALGTKKLSDGGNKNAGAIIARMQQLGVTVGDNKATPTTATTPAAAPDAAAPVPAAVPPAAPAPSPTPGQP